MAISGTQIRGRSGKGTIGGRDCNRPSGRRVDRISDRDITARQGSAILASLRIRQRSPSSDRGLPHRTALSPVHPMKDVPVQHRRLRRARPQPQWLLRRAAEHIRMGPGRTSDDQIQGSCRPRSGAIQSTQTAAGAAVLRVPTTARQPFSRLIDNLALSSRHRLTLRARQHRNHQPLVREHPLSQNSWLASDLWHPMPSQGRGNPALANSDLQTRLTTRSFPCRHGGGHRLFHGPQSTCRIARWGVSPMCEYRQIDFGPAGASGGLVPTIAGRIPAFMCIASRFFLLRSTSWSTKAFQIGRS